MIVWENYIWERETQPIITMEEIETLEKEWEVVLPEDYKSILLENQGKGPKQDSVSVGDGITNFCCLLTLSTKVSRESYSLRKMNKIIKDHLTSRVFPFARDSGGNFFCFDYRHSDIPSVVFLYPDEGEENDEDSYFIKVADSFQDFLSKLY